MDELMWLDTCARRLTELQDEISRPVANRIAIRIWHSDVAGVRQDHPVVVAEQWHSRRASPPPAS